MQDQPKSPQAISTALVGGEAVAGGGLYLKLLLQDSCRVFVNGVLKSSSQGF